MSTFSDMMNNLIDSRGVTRADVAKATGVSEATLYRMTDRSKPNYQPKEETLYAVAIYLELNDAEWDWLCQVAYPKKHLLAEARQMGYSIKETETLLYKHGYNSITTD
ncbi:MAG: helix-turn-helix domain-containing protein [Oscillospiraceae bacterium]|nr:helix-turn-helix domain-containing protein [Oscillospiraceae bacterium]